MRIDDRKLETEEPLGPMVEASQPLISVVIPTRDRPPLAIRAVQSALRQTLNEIEVIVVIDGPDEPTQKVLQDIPDPRMRTILLPTPLGAGEARNVGVDQARGPWIAFLDDDDEWLPKKLEIQLERAKQSTWVFPIVSCRLIARNETGDLIWPRRFPTLKEHLSEYLFCQKGLFGGEGIIIPSTLLVPKEILVKVPFKKGLKRHHDIDWLLRASALSGVGIEFVPLFEPLTIWNMDWNRDRLSHHTDWRASLSWANENRDLFTSRAYASFVMIWVSLTAFQGRDWKAFWSLPLEAYRYGKIGLIEILAHLIIWMIPERWRRQWTIWFDRMPISRQKGWKVGNG